MRGAVERRGSPRLSDEDEGANEALHEEER
jgi:hypothetical protein